MDSDLLIRALCSFLSGTLLSVAGSLSQLITFNPMSSPSTLGIQAYVVLLVLINYFLSVIGLLPFQPISVLIISFATIIIIKLLQKNKSVERYANKVQAFGDKIVIAGICFNLFVGSLFAFVHFLSMSLNIRFPSSIWYGHFKFADTTSTVFLIITFLISFIFIKRNSKTISYLNLGVDFVNSLGIDTRKFSKNSLVLILLISSVIISFFGVFSFLGLIFPHFLRTLKIFKTNLYLEVLLGSLLCGLILMGFDLLCYNFLFYGAEIPVGMISSVVGAFYLVFWFVRSPLLKSKS